MANLVGKNILIVDEVDDSRTTLEYAVKELQKDVQTTADKLGTDEKTQFSVFVLHVSITCAETNFRNAPGPEFPTALDLLAEQCNIRTRTKPRRATCPRT